MDLVDECTDKDFDLMALTDVVAILRKHNYF